ncbi:acetyltransferase [Kordiimonas sp.]|uniref:acetyltransferase n=1 Tax=Kordiimonas sp. TaxID=1970157 RepID=UPI003A95DFB2
MTFRSSVPSDLGRLFDIWHAAVVATHDFLSPEQRQEIAEVVKAQYLPSADFLVYEDTDGKPLGFMGCSGANIDALFVDPEAHGMGIGTRFIDHMKVRHEVLTVQVNEQQPQAHAFYHKCGFRDVRRDPTDDAGRPFPIIHLEWAR